MLKPELEALIKDIIAYEAPTAAYAGRMMEELSVHFVYDLENYFGCMGHKSFACPWGDDPKTIVSSVDSWSVTLRNLRTLDRLAWVDDDVINVMIGMMKARHAERSSQRDDAIGALAAVPGFASMGLALPERKLNIVFFNSHYWATLTRAGKNASGGAVKLGYLYDANLAKWTTKMRPGYLHPSKKASVTVGVNIFDAECVIIPINHFFVHWALLAIWPQRRQFAYFDSHPDAATTASVERDARQLLRDEHKDKMGDDIDTDSWEMLKLPSPEQDNLSDCGIFMLMNAFLVSLGLEQHLMCYGQGDVPHLRCAFFAMITNKVLPPHFMRALYMDE